MDMMVDDASAASISDKIKEILYTKSAERIETARPLVGAELFGDKIPEVEDETEVTNELETEVEPQEEEEPDETVN